MRTESDLRDALSTLEGQAPDARAVLEPLTGGPAPRPSRPRVLIAVVAATMLAVAAVPALRAVTSDDGQTAEPPSPWRYSFTLSAPSGWRILSQSVTRNEQSANLIKGRDQCIVVSFAPGVFDTGLLSRARTPVRVNGHAGLIADVYSFQPGIDKKHPGSVPPWKKVPRPAVAWEYAPDAWRLVDCAYFAVEADRGHLIDLERMMANAVSDTPRPFRTPVRIGYLPDGWQPSGASNEGEPGGTEPDFVLEVPEPGSAELPSGLPMVRPDAPSPPPTTAVVTLRALRVEFTRGTTPPATRGGTRTTINGRPAWVWNDPKPVAGTSNPPVTSASITIQGDGFSVSISSMSSHADFTGELRRVAEHLTIASDPLDETTWFDGSDALP